MTKVYQIVPTALHTASTSTYGTGGNTVSNTECSTLHPPHGVQYTY